jgi:sulfatase modifying factor 1
MKQSLILFFLTPFFLINSVFAQENSEATRLGNLTYPEMVVVEGGTFTMGDEWGVSTSNNELPTHEVTLKGFKISKTEVTVKQYRQFCKESGKAMPTSPTWGWQDNYPIVNVSWYDAVAYCDWLSDKLGSLCALPTEAEWEYAARGGKVSNGFKFSGGQSLTGLGWFADNSNEQTQAVATKKANELGLYDMSGNVLEWCRDWYDGSYYANSPSSNPKGPSTGSIRVLRGGSWDREYASSCRVAARYAHTAADHTEVFGFRVVLFL